MALSKTVAGLRTVIQPDIAAGPPAAGCFDGFESWA